MTIHVPTNRLLYLQLFSTKTVFDIRKNIQHRKYFADLDMENIIDCGNLEFKYVNEKGFY